MRRRKQNNHRRVRRYDLKMIRDFLDHQLWEYRVSQYEQYQSEDVRKRRINPELADQLAKYSSRYSAVLLPLIIADDESPPTPGLREALQQRNDAAITTLESAKEIITDALGVAKKCYNLNPTGSLKKMPAIRLTSGENGESGQP